MKKDQQYYTYGSNKESVMHAICDAFNSFNIKNPHYVCNDPESIFFSYQGEVHCAGKEDKILQWMILNNPLYKKLDIKINPKFNEGDSIEKIGEKKTYTVSRLDTKVQIYYITDGTNNYELPFSEQDDYDLPGKNFKVYDYITNGEIYGTVEEVNRLNKVYKVQFCTKKGQSYNDFYLSFSEQDKWRKAIIIKHEEINGYLTGDVLKYKNEYIIFHLKHNKPGYAIVHTLNNEELTVNIDSLEPVLLTDDILLKNGFRYDGNSFTNSYKKGIITLFKDKIDNYYYIDNNIHIKYFHELQRLYNITKWDKRLTL